MDTDEIEYLFWSFCLLVVGTADQHVFLVFSVSVFKAGKWNAKD